MNIYMNRDCCKVVFPSVCCGLPLQHWMATAVLWNVLVMVVGAHVMISAFWNVRTSVWNRSVSHRAVHFHSFTSTTTRSVCIVILNASQSVETM